VVSTQSIGVLQNATWRTVNGCLMNKHSDSNNLRRERECTRNSDVQLNGRVWPEEGGGGLSGRALRINVFLKTSPSLSFLPFDG